MLRSLVVAVATFAFTPAAAADEPSRAPPAAAPGAWALEAGGVVAREAWDYNRSDEDMWGGTMGVWYRAGASSSIGAEIQVLWVHQERVPDTPLAALSLAGRREFQVRGVSYFAELAAGVSYAARFVPERGTRFNFLTAAGIGVLRTVAPDVHLVGSLRWIHLSNNGMAGRSRNPDIQALGVRVGVHAPLRRRTPR